MNKYTNIGLKKLSNLSSEKEILELLDEYMPFTQTSKEILSDIFFYTDSLILTEVLVKLGVDVNYQNEKGKTALFSANLEKTKLLINLGIDVNKLSMKEQNSLFEVSDIKKAQVLITSGININQLDVLGENILFKNNFSENLIDFFIESGVNPLILNKNEETILFKSNKKTECFINLGVNVNHLNKNNENALFFSSTEATKILLKNNIDIHIVNKYGESAISHIKANLNLKKMEILKQFDFNFNLPDRQGNSILFKSSGMKKKVLVNLIENYNIDVNILNKNGENIGFFVSSVFLEYLLSKGLDCNVINNQKKDLFYTCDGQGIKLLLENKKNINYYSLKSLLLNTTVKKEIIILLYPQILKKISCSINKLELGNILNKRNKNIKRNKFIENNFFYNTLKEVEIEVLRENIQVSNIITERKRI